MLPFEKGKYPFSFPHNPISIFSFYYFQILYNLNNFPHMKSFSSKCQCHSLPRKKWKQFRCLQWLVLYWECLSSLQPLLVSACSDAYLCMVIVLCMKYSVNSFMGNHLQISNFIYTHDVCKFGCANSCNNIYKNDNLGMSLSHHPLNFFFL